MNSDNLDKKSIWYSLRNNWQLVIIVSAIIIVTLTELLHTSDADAHTKLSTQLNDSTWIPPSLFQIMNYLGPKESW